MGAYEQAVLAAARPHVLAAAGRAALSQEVTKGCSPKLSPNPLALEPPFRPIRSRRDLGTPTDEPTWIVERPPNSADLARFRVWISPKQHFDWKRSELFLKGLTGIRRRLVWELVGNRERIGLTVLCGRDDVAMVRAAFQGQFENCVLAESEWPPLAGFSANAWGKAAFADFFPRPPSSRRGGCRCGCSQTGPSGRVHC